MHPNGRNSKQKRGEFQACFAICLHRESPPPSSRLAISITLAINRTQPSLSSYFGPIHDGDEFRVKRPVHLRRRRFARRLAAKSRVRQERVIRGRRLQPTSRSASRRLVAVGLFRARPDDESLRDIRDVGPKSTMNAHSDPLGAFVREAGREGRRCSVEPTVGGDPLGGSAPPRADVEHRNRAAERHLRDKSSQLERPRSRPLNSFRSCAVFGREGESGDLIVPQCAAFDAQAVELSFTKRRAGLRNGTLERGGLVRLRSMSSAAQRASA
jgi:hypothetical protein